MWKAPRLNSGRSPESKEQDRFRKKNDPVNRLYWLASWFRFKLHCLNRNPICQRIIRGEQCHNPAWVVHHLISPRERPDLFLDATNVVCLCANCHPGGEEGTPEWKEGVDYVPSLISPPTVA